MNKVNLKRASLSALIAWVIGVTAFVTSYFVPIMDDLDTQANWVLMFAIIPASLMGAHLYYRKGYTTNGLILGSYMFFITMILDAFITVPLFIIPYGGNHLSFFGDPGFWLIGIEYIGAITFYWLLQKSNVSTRVG